MRVLNRAVFFIPSFVLAACGGGASPSNIVPGSPVDTTQSVAERSDFALQNDRWGDPNRHHLYVANTGNNSITVYDHAASGDARPLRVIAGSKTLISQPSQLFEDAEGDLYVTNSAPFLPDGSVNPSDGILVFANGADGNVAPIRRIAGPHTLIHWPRAVTVDHSNGDLYVLDEGVNTAGASALLRFAPGATGDVAPVSYSYYEFGVAVQIDMNSSRNNVIEAFTPQCCDSDNAGVVTIEKRFDNHSPATPYDVTAFLNSTGVADDATSQTYLTLGTGGDGSDGSSLRGIYRFAEDTTGEFDDEGNPQRLTPAPISIITSDTCGGQLAVGHGALPKTFVTHGTQLGCASDAVFVYAHDASGNAEPMRILSGPRTRLDEPLGIYVGP